MKKEFKEGQEVKVELERRPIYAHHGYVESAKLTRRTLIVEKVIENGRYVVVTKGQFRNVGGVKVPMRHRLSMNEKHDFGEMYNENTRYEVEPI